MGAEAAPWEADAPAERRAPTRTGGAEPWRRDEARAPDEHSREAMDSAITAEDYLIPGTNIRIPGTKGVNTFLIATGRGMIDLWAGGKQIALKAADVVAPRETSMSNLVTGEKPASREAEYTREQDQELREFARLEKASPVTTFAGRVAGQVAPTLVVPFGAVAKGAHAASKAPGLAVLARAGAGTEAAVMGGLQGAMNFVPEGESRALNTVAGAAAGGLAAKGLEHGARIAAPALRQGAERLGLPQLAGTRPAMTADEVAAAVKAEGIDWAQLGADVRTGLVVKANEAAKAGTPITPAELARVARAEALPGGPAHLTKGQMTGDRQQLREEFDLRRTKSGQSLDEQLVAQDKALADSLDVIKLRTGGQTSGMRAAETGEKLTGPLVKQLEVAQGKVSAAYKKADEAGETLTEVSATPLAQFLIDNRAASVSVPELKTIAAKLKDMGVASGEDLSKATGAAAWIERQPNIRELEELRKLAVQIGRKDDAAGHYMGEVKRVIDEMTEGQGGELYKAARAARISLREQFEDPGVIHALVGTNRQGERLTDFDNVFKKTVLNGSRDDLDILKSQLLTGAGDDPKLHTAGLQAFKDLRGATLDYLKLGATSNAKDEFSYAGFKRAAEAIGPEKLEVIFGKNTANQIQSVLESAKDMKAPFNKEGIRNPGTASAFIDWIDRITGLVGLGRVGSYTAGGARKVWEGLNESTRVGEATRPVQAAVSAGEAATAATFRDLMGMYGGKAGAAAAPAVAAAAAKPEKRDGK